MCNIYRTLLSQAFGATLRFYVGIMRKFKDNMVKQITGGGPVKGEDWLQLSRKLAQRTRARLARINETGKFKPVRKEKIRRDNQYMHIWHAFQNDEYSHTEYVRRIVKLRRKHDMPKSKKAFLRRLDRSLDSDSE